MIRVPGVERRPELLEYRWTSQRSLTRSERMMTSNVSANRARAHRRPPQVRMPSLGVRDHRRREIDADAHRRLERRQQIALPAAELQHARAPLGTRWRKTRVSRAQW